jgi:hypothetical protein
MNTQKKYKFGILMLVLLLSLGCSKDDEKFTTWPVPEWKVESPELLPNSFTAIVALPDNLNLYATPDDKIAAFMDDNCCGVGTLVEDEGGARSVYFLTIRASDTGMGQITFRYYNARMSYLYEASQTVEFEPDGTFGSYDEPVVLDLMNL